MGLRGIDNSCIWMKPLKQWGIEHWKVDFEMYMDECCLSLEVTDAND